MSNTYDQDGHHLGGLPPDAVRVNSSLIMLSGKYVDSDGVIYDADGTVNEPATAAWAREQGMKGTAGPQFWKDPYTIRMESVRENSEYDAAFAAADAWYSNVFQTGAEIPGRFVDVGKDIFSGFTTSAKWLVIGLVAYAVIQATGGGYEDVKRRAVKAGRKRVKQYRRKIARHVAGD